MGGGGGGVPPNNYLIPSILTTIFCCLPLGIVGIVFATQVNNKWTIGDYAGAEDSARKAKMFTWISFGLGLAWIAIVVIWYIFVIALAASSTPTYSTY